MKKQLLLFFIFLLAFKNNRATEHLILNGTYYGNNLFVQSPFSPDGVGFCIVELKVNDKLTNDEIAQNLVEIHLNNLGLKIGDPVHLSIYYKTGCGVKVLNPEVLRKDNPDQRSPSVYCFIHGKFVDEHNKIPTKLIQTIMTNKKTGLVEGVGMSELESGTYLMLARYGQVYELSFSPQVEDTSGKITDTYYAKKVVLDLRNIPMNDGFDEKKEVNTKFVLQSNKEKSLSELFTSFPVGKLAYDPDLKKLKWDEDYANAITETSSVLIKQLEKDHEVKQLEIQKKNDDLILQEQRTIRNVFIAAFIIVLILILFVFRSYRQKKRANIEIIQQKTIIEEKNKDILDSIHYARRIQTSLLPTEKYIDKSLMHLKKN